MPRDVKKARQAIDNAQHAGRQAKYFLKFMDALGHLDDCLADLGGIEGQASAAEKRKADAEAAIPDLERRVAEKERTLAGLSAEHTNRVEANDRELSQKATDRKAELDAQHAAVKREAQAEIQDLNTQKTVLLDAIKDLLRQKREAETAVRRLQTSIQKAGQSLHTDA